MHRFARLALIAALAMAPSADAQQTVPPAAPTIGASAGGGAGIAIPVGRLSNTHAAGYTLAGLIDFSAAEQPYSFRAELIYQHYDRKASAPAGTKNANIVSFGASLLMRSAKQASSMFLLGGIAVYRMADNGGTKPGLNAGAGMEVPLTFFIGIADIRLHVALTENKPTLTIPITLGARF